MLFDVQMNQQYLKQLIKMKNNRISIYRTDDIIYTPNFFNPINWLTQNASSDILNYKIDNVART